MFYLVPKDTVYTKKSWNVKQYKTFPITNSKANYCMSAYYVVILVVDVGGFIWTNLSVVSKKVLKVQQTLNE